MTELRFLLDANMPRAAAAAITEAGHEAVLVRDTPLRGSPDELIAAYARQRRMVLLTRDFDFADVRSYPPTAYTGIVVFGLPETATADFITAVVRSFLSEPTVLDEIAGKLAIVEAGRIRLRSV